MKIAIIGAGMAGLTAATELQRKGATVQVFEKSHGTGGRLASKRLDWGQMDTGAQYFTARSGGFHARVKQWEAAGAAAQWAFTPYRLTDGALQPSPDEAVRYVGTPRMTSIARYMAKDLDVAFQTRIEQLSFDGEQWALYTTDEQKLNGFDWVVSSIPAEQAAVMLDTSSDLARDIPEEVHNPCWALALATRGHVPEDIQGIFGDDVVSWVSRLSAMPGRECPEGSDDLWMLHFSAQWSREHANDTADAVYAEGLAWLRSRLQADLVARQHYGHFWRYANLADPESPRPYRVEKSRNLAVIGAWCCGGRVEGAYQSAMHLMSDYFS